MAAKDLITLSRAKTNLPQITDASQDSRLAAFITAVSDAIEKYCRRDFYARNYDELYTGKGDKCLLLRQYPIQSVKSVRLGPAAVLRVKNSDSAANQQANVQVVSTGLTLTRVASGVSSSTTPTFAANPTLQALAAAINALGNGWSAQVVGDAAGDFGLWASADLYVPPSFGDGLTSQGSLNARGRFAEVRLHVEELTEFQFDPRGWLLLDGGPWPMGCNNIRVRYTGGYTTIPEAVQEACAEWVAELYWLTLRDPSATAFSQTGVAGTSWQPEANQPSKVVQRLLSPYRRHVV